MTAIIPLGTFDRVSLRDAWPRENENFTPWLAKPENIKLLGDALNMELEVEAVEHRVGSFLADILAQAVDEADHRVIIENQFGRTDHGHLGQILTYLAGIDGAKTVVWIAETIQSDHRAAVDWLNANTTEDFSFFAIEIELWRIGTSPPAPRFNVIASPNDWTRTTRTAVRGLDEGLIEGARAVSRAYWSSFAEYLEQQRSAFHIRRLCKDHWFSFGIGRSSFNINATVSTEKRGVGVELYNSNDPTKTAFRALEAQKAEIEQEFGERLSWEELPGKKATRIAVYKHDVNPADAKQYPELHAWMLTKMDRMKQVFGRRVRALPAGPAAVDDGEESPEE